MAAQTGHSARAVLSTGAPLLWVQGLHPFLCSVPESRWTNLPRFQSPGPPGLTLTGDSRGHRGLFQNCCLVDAAARAQTQMSLIMVDLALGTSRWPLLVAAWLKLVCTDQSQREAPSAQSLRPHTGQKQPFIPGRGALNQEVSVIDSQMSSWRHRSRV